MKELVFLNNSDEPVTTSLIVARDFEKEHKNVIAQIRKLSAEILADLPVDGYNPKFTECSYVDSWNRQQPYFEMNRDAFVELVGNMNTAKAREWKRKYYAAFNKMEQALQQLALQRPLIRQSTKFTQRKLTDAVKEFVIPNARANGSTAPDKVFYMTYNKLFNKVANVPAGQRDNLTISQLIMLDQMQDVAAANIRIKAKRGANYKDIYSVTKTAVEGYAQIALVQERLQLK